MRIKVELRIVSLGRVHSCRVIRAVEDGAVAPPAGNLRAEGAS